MQKVSFFRSIHLKIVLIFMLLFIIAMQIIGVYFVGKLEDNLKENFQTSIEEKEYLLSYNIRRTNNKDRTAEDVH